MEMLEHINNILIDISNLEKNDKYKFKKEDLKILKENISLLKKCLDDKIEISNLNLTKIKETENILYKLNNDNLFSLLTDHMSNEFYAFEFLIQEKLREKEV